ncbi:MAG: hypothetical protein N2738_07485, partial [Thermodesulfovibrionales bacterium]|nr:hypothetical protein [Thermodesulfovibrionales bacterium]
LFNSLTTSIKTIEVVETYMSDVQEARRFMDIISREVESTIFRANDEKATFRFTERDHYGMPYSEMQFLSLSTSPRGIFIVVYKTEANKDTMKILKKMYPSTAKPEDFQWEEVISDILGFSIIAFNSKGELVKNWDSSISQSIPDEIKITLYLKTNINNKDKEIFAVSEVVKTRINKPL